MTVEQAAYNRLQSKLANQGRPQLGPLVEPSIENSANESNVLEIVAQAAAFYIGDPIAGEKILAAATDNNSDIIAKMRSGVIERYNLSEAERLDTSFQVTFTPNDAAKSQEAGHSIEMVSPYSTEAPIGNIIPEANTPTRVAYQRDSRNTGERFEELQTFKGGRWIASESILPSETNKWIEPTNLVDIMIK